jgi:hypothetical protein
LEKPHFDDLQNLEKKSGGRGKFSREMGREIMEALSI